MQTREEDRSKRSVFDVGFKGENMTVVLAQLAQAPYVRTSTTYYDRSLQWGKPLLSVQEELNSESQFTEILESVRI